MNYSWDHVYFDGKYYSYYGIAPVVLLFLPYHKLTGYYFPDSLAVLLRLLSATEKRGSQLSLALEREEDATVFRVRNGSEIPVYVNVLRVSGDDLTVCLEFDGREGSEGVLLDAGSEVVLEQYPFVVQEGARYLVFGTVRSYDTRSLQRALRRGGSQDALTGGFVY